MNFKDLSHQLQESIVDLKETLPFGFDSVRVGTDVYRDRYENPYVLIDYYLSWKMNLPVSFEYNFNILKKYVTPDKVDYFRKKIPELIEHCFELAKAARLAAYKEPEWFEEFYWDENHYREVYDLDGEDCCYSKSVLMGLVPEFESFLLTYPDNEYRADLEESIRSIKEFNSRKEKRDHAGIMKTYKMITEIRFKMWIKDPRWDPEFSPWNERAYNSRIREYKFQEYATGSPLSRSLFALSRGDEDLFRSYLKKYSRVFLSFGILLSSYKLKDFASKYLKGDFNKLAIDSVFQKIIPICLRRIYDIFDFNAMTCLQLLEITEPKLSESCKDEESREFCKRFVAEIEEVYKSLEFTRLDRLYMSYEPRHREGYKIYLENKDNGSLTMMGDPGYDD